MALAEFLGPDGQVMLKEGRRDRRLPGEPRKREWTLRSLEEKADRLKVWDEISAACERDELIEGVISQRVKGGLPSASAAESKRSFRARKWIFARFATWTVHRQAVQVQGHQVQQKARQHCAVAPRSPRKRARRAEKSRRSKLTGRPDRRRYRQEPDRVRRLHRPRWNRRSASHHRHELGPGQSPLRAVPSWRSRPRQSAQVQRETERVSLGLKADHRRSVEPRGGTLHPGTVVKGKVVSLKDYGAFIELEEGIEGLVYISEMSRGPAGSSTRRRSWLWATRSKPSCSTSMPRTTASRSV